MILRGTPKDEKNYIKVNKMMAKFLHYAGFKPSYIDDKYIYFARKDIINGRQHS